jgi:hypothetical protein
MRGLSLLPGIGLLAAFVTGCGTASPSVPVAAPTATAGHGSSMVPARESLTPVPASSLTPTPASTAIDTTTWSAFVSDRHGYRTRYPSDWTAKEATQPWLFGQAGDEPNDATVDRFDAPNPAAALVVSSQAIPQGTTETEWWAVYLATMAEQPAGCSPPRDRWEPIMISGQPAWVHGGFARCNYTEAVAIVNHRAYVFTAYADVRAASGRVFDRRLFDAFLASVRFQPQAANDKAVTRLGRLA